MYHVVYPFSGNTWTVGACVEDDADIVAELHTDFRSDESEDCEALSQLLHDEFGDADALYNGGELFDVVAVPDDVCALEAPGQYDLNFDPAMVCPCCGEHPDLDEDTLIEITCSECGETFG